MAEETLVPWSKYAEDPGYAELSTKEKLDLFKDWHKATVANVQNLGMLQTKEDEDYLNNYLTQAYDSVLDTQSGPELVYNAAKRSMLNTQEAALVSAMATGGLPATGEASLQLAKIQKELAELPSSSTVRKYGSNELPWWDIFKHPVALTEFLAENLPAQWATQVAADTAGTAIGGAIGARGGVPGAAVGAEIGGLTAQVSSAAAYSFLMEYSGSVIQQLQEKGVDVEDPAQISKAFGDKEFFKPINEKAVKKGMPSGALDALAMFLGYKAGKKLPNLLRTTATRGFTPVVKLLAKEGAKELGVQAGLGMAGEALGQYASEGKITDINAIALEGILEGPENITGFAKGVGVQGAREILSRIQSDPISKMRASELAKNLQENGTIQQADSLAQAGAPKTAQAVVQAEAKNSLESSLENDIDQAQESTLETPEQKDQPTSSEPAPQPEQQKEQDKFDAQNTLDAAKVWGNIRARKPVSADEVERLGFMLPVSWKLNEKTGNFEFQGVPDEAQKGETAQAPAVTTAAEPAQTETPVVAETTAPVETEQPAPAQQGQAAVAPALTQETKDKTEDLPAWEQVQKNKDQIRYLKSIFKKANAKLPEDQRVEPKAGWKRGDYLKNLENIYGKISGLEKTIENVPGNPETIESANEEQKRRGRKKANLKQKLYNVRDSKLTGEQQTWKEIVFSNMRRIANEVAQRFPNIPNVDDYIFDDLLRKTANYLAKNPAITEDQLTDKAVSSILASWADDSAKDAGQSAAIQGVMNSSPLLEQVETSDKPARTQSELDEEEKAAGDTKQLRAQTQTKEAPGTKLLTESGYNPAREKLGPDQKLILDWIINKLTGSATPSGIETKNLQSYEDLAKFLSTLNKKKTTAKAVSKMATEAREALAAELQKAGVGVTADQISTALTPEGEQARAKAKAKAEKDAAVAKEKQERQETADRGRNSTQNQYLAQKLVDAGMESTPETRQRLVSEVIEPLENGNLEESQAEERISNIQKGQLNEKITTQPESREPVSGRRKRPGVRKQPGANESSGSSPAQSRGAPVSVGTDQGQSQSEQATGSGTRPGGRGTSVGQEQRETAANVPQAVDIDPELESNNLPRGTKQAVKELLDVLRQINFPGKVRLGDTENPVYVRKGDRAGLTIYVSPQALAAQKRQIFSKFGGKPGEAVRRWAQYRFMAVATHETVHNVHLKQLQKEANQLGLTFDQHLANEVKRVAKFLNRNRQLKKYVAYLYNGDRKFANNEQQYFEFIRMLVENETMGRTTESATMSAEDVAQFMDDEDRRWLVNFIESIIQGLTNIASRILGTNAKDAEYLSNTAKLLRQLNRDLLNPPKKERVVNNYVEPKQEFVPKQTKADTKAAEEEVKKLSGLSNQSKKFLEDYAKELGIKVPTFKQTYTVFNEKTRKHEQKTVYRPAWKKEQYVEAIKAKLKELNKKPKDVLGAAPMRFKTEYGLMRFDQNLGGNQRGVLKGIAADKNNTIPWLNLKAKVLKNTSRAEAEWILPTLEALVRNDRVDVDQAKQAMRALAQSKIQVVPLAEGANSDTSNPLSQTEFIVALKSANTFLRQMGHRLESFYSRSVSETILYELMPIENNQDAGFTIMSSSDEGREYGAGLGLENDEQPVIQEFNLEDLFSSEDLGQSPAQFRRERLGDVPLGPYLDFRNDYRKFFAETADKVLGLRILKENEKPFISKLQELYLKTINESKRRGLNQRKLDAIKAVFGKNVYNLAITNSESGALIENADERASIRYPEVNPKPLTEMEDVREILVKTPIGNVAGFASHFKDKDVVGFGRMYTTTQNNKTGTFLFEVQTDASQSPLEEAQNPDFPFTTYEFSPLITASKEEDLLQALKIGAKNPDSISFDELGNVVYFHEHGKSTIAEHIEGTTYKVIGGWGMKLVENIKKNPKLSETLKPNLKDQVTADLVEVTEMFAEAAPLVSAYESLVLKSAINDAINKGHEFIAITDDETAAMTEGHQTVNDGMRAHYNPRNGSLHNLAKKLTGDAGIAFDDGKSLYAYDQKIADELERPALPRYPKETVTGVAYSLDRLKALGDASPANDILGAAVPSDRPTWLKPDGETIAVDEDVLVDMDGLGNHSKAALEYLEENEPESKFLGEWKLLDPFQKSEQSQRVVEEMIQKGWVRVVGDGFNIYFEGSPNETQFNKLYEAAIEDEARLIQDLTGITGKPKSKVIYEPPTSGVIGAAAMPRRGFISSSRQREQKRGTVRLPDSIEDLALVKYMEGGSHMVGLYESADGDRFIVKTGQTRQQFENEIAAENIYRILGYPVADSKLIEVDGQTAKIAEFLSDGFSLREFREQFLGQPDLIQKVYDQLADGMLIDAYLFNYDSIGVNMQDNVLIRLSEVPSADGETLETVPTIYRIDSGGTFDTKAFEETPRNEPFFYDSLKVMQKNYPYLRLTPSDLIAQISDLVLNSDAIINAVPQRLQMYMANRLQYMADQLSAVDILTPITGITEQQTETFFEKLREQMAAVKVSRDNQGRLINPATGRPSMISGLGPNDAQVPKSEFRYRLERTPLFKAWFGDWENSPRSSRILDEAGEPRLMYHGTGKYIQKYSDLFLDEVTKALKTPSYIRRFGMNRFKGVWTSTKRSWAEKWANDNNPAETYHEQVVFPMYVKSTNPFDPRDKKSVEKLLTFLKNQGQQIDPEDEYTLLNGLFDWRFFEGTFDKMVNESAGEDVVVMPDVNELRATGATEESIRKAFAKTYSYRTLKAIVDLGYDGVWAQENLDKPELYNVARNMARGVLNDPTNQQYQKDFDAIVQEYNKSPNVAWNFLAFRRDGVKSAMNTGMFSSIKDPAALRRTNEASKLEGRVTVDSPTGRNKLVYQGQTLYSTDSPAALATYAVASPSALARHNIAKIALKNQPNSFIYQQRTAPSPTTTKKYPVNDILGAAEVRPRRFGLRLPKYLGSKIMDALKNKNYEPLPDKMALSEAKAYLDKHGLEKSSKAALANEKDMPVRAGVQEMLGMMVIQGYRDKVKDDPEAAGDLATFIDEFLEKSTETGRALRAYRFLTMLGPDGLQALYYKKARIRDARMRESFQNFISKASEKLEPLSQEAMEKVIKEMEKVLAKATKLARSNTRKIAAKTTMTLWQQFADQVGQGMTEKVTKQLEALEQSQEQGEEGEGKPILVDGKPPRTINQEASAALRKIRAMIDNLAKEQGTSVKEADITGEEVVPASDEQVKALQELQKKQNTVSRLSDLISLWPKALQAWMQIKDTIRQEVAANPKLAPLFEEYLKTALDQPFTIPQIRNLMKASDIDIKELIREHYRQGTLGQHASDLARLFMEKANLGSLGLKTEQELAESQGMKKEGKASIEVEPSIAEKLQEALAKKIEETIRDEAQKTLVNLVDRMADRRLEPSLKRFLDRMVKMASYGLLDANNIQLWNKFAEQEGLTDPKIAEEVYNLAKKGDSLPEGYQRNVYYQKAMRAIYEKTQMSQWDFAMTWWYFSILSGTDTQLANALGNLSQSTIIMLPQLGWAALQGRGGKEHYSAMLRGLSNGFNDFVHVLATGNSYTKQSQLSINSLQATDTGEVLLERSENKLKKSLGFASSVVRRLMSGVDLVFYNANKEFYLYRQAFDAAYNDGKSGLTKKQAAARALEFVARDSNSFKGAGEEAVREGFKPGSREYKLRVAEILDQRLSENKTESGEERNVDTQAMLNESIASALNNTFNQEPRGFLGAVGRVINILAAQNPQTRFVIPFTRIVANVWNASIDMSGWGLARYYGAGGIADKLLRLEGTKLSLKNAAIKAFGKDLFEWEDVKGSEKEMLRARAFFGLLGVSVIAGLQAFGYDKDYEKAWWRVNGSGPDDPQAKQALMKTGWKPWSVKIGDTYFSYLMTPLAIPLAVIGEITDNHQYGKTGAKAMYNVADAAIMRAILVPFDMMFLSGLSDMFKMTDSSQPEQAKSRAKAFFSRIVSSMIVPNILRDIDQRAVPALLSLLGVDVNWGNKTAKATLTDGMFIANTPILREMVGKPEIDLLGNQIPYNSRIMSQRMPDPLVETLARKNAFPSPARRELMLGMIPMEDDEFYQYRVYRGEMLKQLLNQPEMIEQLRQSKPYVAQEIVKKVSESATEYAKGKIIEKMVSTNDPRIQKLQHLGEWIQNQED